MGKLTDMALVRRLLTYFSRPKKRRRGYTEEVLYAGWVDVPLAPGKSPARRR